MSPADNIQCGCDTKNPLERDGTSQAQRLLAALDPGYISVDERKPEDLLMFALSYAAQLKYFDDKNEHDGDWVGFLKNDISTLVAIIAKTDPGYYRDAFSEIYDEIFANGTTTSRAESLLKELSVPIQNILLLIDKWYRACDERVKLKKDLDLYYRSVFAQAYAQLISIDLASMPAEADIPMDLGVIDLNEDWSVLLNTDYRKYPTLPADDDGSQILPTSPDLSAFVPQDPDDISELGKIKSAALAISLIFDRFVNTLISIIDKTPGYLTESLELFPYHKAHTGLFLAFIELFGEAQKHINKTTKRHLDFYYESVLQLARHDAVADKVHIIFELAKVVAGTDTFLVDELTLLKAGKDTSGKPVFFSTDESIVVSHAKAALFSSMFIETTAGTPGKTALYASPVANSSDGIGGALDKEIPQWKAFGESQQDKTGSARTMPDATVGFAVASPQLILKEGVRVITLSMQFSAAHGFTAAEITRLQTIGYYTFEFTGPKGWLAFDPSKNVSVRNKTTSVIESLPEAKVQIVGNKLVCTLVLDETQPALSAYSSKAHEGTYSTAWPIIRVKLNNYDSTPGNATNDNDNVFALLRDKKTDNIKLKVEVDKVKTLIIQNDQAKFDPSKPFFPFGVQPSEGSNFYIGSEEIFYKRLDKLELHFQWHDVAADLIAYYKNYDIVLQTPPGTPTTTLVDGLKASATGITGITGTVSGSTITWSAATHNNDIFTAELDYLNEKKWTGYTSSPDISLFENKTASNNGAKEERPISITPSTAGQAIFGNLERAKSFDELKEYTNDTQRGFIRMVLNGPDFQHKIYPSVLMKSAILPALQGTIVQQPYTPVIKSIYANYSSEQVMETGTDVLYHIHPFGEENIDLPASSTASLIVPSFSINSDDNDSTVLEQQEGMLFIGLENANPDESVSMLVQVVEDSGDPDVTKPDKVFWSYLRENTWVKLLQSQVLTDTTNGFITSGIIKLAIPSDATSNSTIMTSGYTWLRASTTEHTAALCNVLDIRAQAVQASFYDQSNDLSRLATPLAAGTIAKLDQPLAEIKGATQPFASFGGKLPELGNEYYRRVSERLHHKARAINMWDYERIVLENFPSIYKVKCVNHNDYNCTSNAELKPGSVCVVVISNLRNQTQVDALKPSTSIGTREEIKTYLQKRCSRFVRMEVVNPTYEEIQVDFKVKFGAAFDADKGYYRNQLESDIRDFLAPWFSDLGADIVFGGKIHASYIINFIEEREYVDYITDFEMYRIERNADNSIVSPRMGPFEEISAQTARSVLVSAPTHNVDTNLATV